MYEKYQLLLYISQLSRFFINICTNNIFIKHLSEKKSYFNNNNDEKLYYKLILLNSRYFNGDFKQAFIELLKLTPKKDIEEYEDNDIKKDIIVNALNIYGMEGYAYFSAKISDKINIFSRDYPGGLFYIGEYSLNLLSSINRPEFMFFEIYFNLDQLSTCDLDVYLKSIYKKTI